MFSVLAIFSLANAQCDDLFISEYVEGYANNKSIEIYNPTNAAVDLSQYSLARFSNGATTAPAGTPSYVVQLPNDMLEPYGTYVVTVDLTVVDASTVFSQFDKPVWNGYLIIDTLIDDVTGLPILDSLGNIMVGPQYDNGTALFDFTQTTYYPEYDLQGKTDAFLCPDYDVNRVMYFNGNDAMALIFGTEVSSSGDNLVDVIGVIGEDPEVTIGSDAWVDINGGWLTKDRTLVRNADIETGRNAFADVVFALGGTFVGTQWTVHPKNDFSNLGSHDCACNSVNTKELNQLDFQVFPNPVTSNEITIESEYAIQSVSVYNTMGQLVSYNEYANQNRINENLPSLSKGMYFIHVGFENDQSSIRKLIVD